jgi:hypothetical protein
VERWAAAQFELHKLICERRVPKEWLQELSAGDIRELALAILTLLVASLHVPLSIAVPITALVVKRRLLAFCKSKPQKPKRGMSAIINGHRKKHRKSREA